MGVPKFKPDPEQPGYLYIKFADFIQDCIKARKLLPGSRLPGEREFAAQQNVSIGTIRRATEELRDRGLVVTLPAKGSFVAPEHRKRHDGTAAPRQGSPPQAASGKGSRQQAAPSRKTSRKASRKAARRRAAARKHRALSQKR